jgi:hypothetical protein
VFLYSCLSYLAWKTHVPCYIVICGLPGCTLFFILYPIRAWFGGGCQIRHKMSVLSFSTTFVWNICHSNKNSESYYVCSSLCKLPIFLVRFLWNLNFLDSFSKILKYEKVNEYPFSRNWGFPIQTDGQMNRHDKTNIHFLRFCEWS